MVADAVFYLPVVRLHRDRKRLNKVVRRGSSLSDCPLDPTEEAGERKMLRKLNSIMDSTSPPPTRHCGGGAEPLSEQPTARRNASSGPSFPRLPDSTTPSTMRKETLHCFLSCQAFNRTGTISYREISFCTLVRWLKEVLQMKKKHANRKKRNGNVSRGTKKVMNLL